MLSILKRLKFDVKDCKSGGHKAFIHPGLIGLFLGSDFNCGHSEGDNVLSVYTKRILDIVVRYEMELRKYLGEQNDD